jgi:collagenase-like PrtC family protease
MERTAELLMPAGSLEKLKVAILYGADAVYMGPPRKGCRLDARARPGSAAVAAQVCKPFKAEA